MSILRKIRIGAAIILLCAIFLPLSECSRHEREQSPQPSKSLSQQLFPQDNDDFAYQYAIGVMRFSTWQAGGFALLALLWPLGFLFLNKKLQPRRFAWSVYLFELLLCVGSIYWLHLFTALGRWLYGAYVGLVAVVVFGCTSLVLLLSCIRNSFARRKEAT
jgi:hypothetical protein